MLAQHLVVACYVPIVEIGKPGIQQYAEKECKVENGEIKPVINNPDNILHSPVNTEYPEWFHQDIQKQKQGQVCNKFALHVADQ